MRGCFWRWVGALVRSGGARAPWKSLILHPCLSEILWGDKKTMFAKFECNRSIFRGRASRFYVTIAHWITIGNSLSVAEVGTTHRYSAVCICVRFKCGRSMDRGWSPAVFSLADSCPVNGNNWTVFVRLYVNPRPSGVWLVTRPAGRGGGGKGPPLRSPKLLDRFPNFKRHSIALYVNYPEKVKNLTRRSLMTSQVRSNSEFSTFRAWWYRRVKFQC